MTTTDAPTTTTISGGVSRITEPSNRSDGPLDGTTTDRGDWWSQSPWITAGEWVDRYVGFVSVTLELTRQVALCWAEPMGWPPEATRQPDTGGDRPIPGQRPTVISGAAASRDAEPPPPVAGDPVARPSRTRTGRSRQPGRDVTTSGQAGRLPAQAGTGFVDGLIGHLMDRDITGSIDR